MSSNVEKRMVEREVRVFRCDKCGIEALHEQLTGWVVAGLLELLEPDVMSAMMGQPMSRQAAVKPGNDRHLCPACAKLLEEAIRLAPTISPAKEALQ